MLVNFVHILLDLFMTFKLYRRVACFVCCLRDYYWTAIIPRIIAYYDYILVPIYYSMKLSKYYILHVHSTYIEGLA